MTYPEPDPITLDSDDLIPPTLRMISPEDTARAMLNGVVSHLGRDELRVLTRIAERLRQGRAAYGPLFLAGDTRTFRGKEAREELEDTLVYLACALLFPCRPHGLHFRRLACSRMRSN
jgi:hypothetical protein